MNPLAARAPTGEAFRNYFRGTRSDPHVDKARDLG